MKKLLVAASFAVAAFSAQASSYTVGSFANSSTGGSALDTISLTAGQTFSVTAAVTDLWNAGPLPRWSNANGLTSSLFATGSDDSGEVLGTQIGQSFGSYTQDGFTAAYGQLVGKVGAQYFALGTNATATTSSAGTLKLFYWDSNNSDNTGSILVNVTAVPEPESYAMLIAGLGLMGVIARRRKANRG